jgi:hypothetical protein
VTLSAAANKKIPTKNYEVIVFVDIDKREFKESKIKIKKMGYAK